MYLEGIFIGGDIRSQLPEEAKRFDQIDKTFKKVSFLSNSPRNREKFLCPIIPTASEYYAINLQIADF